MWPTEVPSPRQLRRCAVVPDKRHRAPQSTPDAAARLSVSPLDPAIPPRPPAIPQCGNALADARFLARTASPTASIHLFATYRSETPQLYIRRRRSKPPPASVHRRVANRHRPPPQRGSSVAAPRLALSLRAASAASYSSSRIIPI